MKKIKVWDLAVRISHLLFGVLILGAFLTSDDDGDTVNHTRLGLSLLAVVLFRVVWGFTGTTHARFTDFVKGPKAVLANLRGMIRGHPDHVVGHNPVGALMVMALLVLMLVTTVTGVLVSLGPEWAGPLAISHRAADSIKELHELSAWAIPVLLVFHVAGVIVSSVLEKQNLIKGMVTGFKQAPESTPLEAPRPLARAAGFATAMLAGLCVAIVLWLVMPIGKAAAAAPVVPLLSVYEAAARVEDKAFTGFDAARGRAFFVAEHPSTAGTPSCATCHTTDPTKMGRSHVGKVIEPLAPSANAERFKDAAKANKWFDRNCKQVLGRVCTSRERGDVLTWLVTL
jgi:cytochrome b